MVYFRCEFILKLKGFNFVKDIVSKLPNLKRPPINNSRFHLTSMQLVPVTDRTYQEQASVDDPQTNSTRAVLNQISTSSSQSCPLTNPIDDSTSALE